MILEMFQEVRRVVLMERNKACVRMVEEAVLKTVGCNRFGGSIPSHTVLVSWRNGNAEA